MASYSFTSIAIHALISIPLLLNLSCLFHNLNLAAAAKHGSSKHRMIRTQRLHRAFLALQAWKHVIYSDPYNFIATWVGPSVCNYKGVFCAPALDDPKIQVVAGIDLNKGDIAGFLPEELGLLSDLALIHLNSNRFCGILPQSIANLTLLYELDLRPLSPQLFQKNLDAIFVNNNRFTNVLPATLGGSSASVLVVANNNFGGCLPPSIVSFANTLEELLLINTNLSGCLPQEVGFLYKLRVLDVSYNKLVGPIPYSLAGLSHLEQLNLAHNSMTGIVPDGVCCLPNLANFTFSYNYFCEEEGICQNLTSKGITFDDRQNCLPEKPHQRSQKECNANSSILLTALNILVMVVLVAVQLLLPLPLPLCQQQRLRLLLLVQQLPATHNNNNNNNHNNHHHIVKSARNPRTRIRGQVGLVLYDIVN
ncbi:leucine-rich repeat extensin-like protein 4 [Prunus yedoensis var. nudiflora]|uniref:Leucine-rich repeat extensin-like protein 4 n=1 Tax=Prunus yedoensis var. nudiflora TaxID=2094558 RepID=A0A314UBB8_PRUYE|nr:leucine-rich repeat extensin-like protein 4 [Prunus yedoensis var. nudiflora]